MRKFLVAATLMALPVVPAHAAIMSLGSIAPSGSNFQWTYGSTLGPDEGVKAGSKFILFDFDGYVPGSIFSSVANLTPSTELFSGTPFVIPGQTDDPTLTNLVFTWNGPAFQIGGGPYPSFTFNGLGALSIFYKSKLDAFTTWTVKNNPVRAAGTPVVTMGEDQLPTASIPEPATWVSMLIGFSMLGVAVRRRRRRGAGPRSIIG
ncbi:MAG TPA: PEPxxWA-CTERM sorting domain-containing protein [Polymorphobacter sp.]|nr:PEPxxWA-CTERM sorting domain-containing protein [Polymorphobacter sp.]